MVKPADRDETVERLIDGLSQDAAGDLLGALLSDPASDGSARMIDDYVLGGRIGGGGGGVVYEAFAPVIDRPLAMKVLHRPLGDRASMARAWRELDVLGSVRTPSVPRVHDYGATPAGEPYIVFERVDGVPLSAYCESNDLSVEARVRLMVRICRVVGELHAQGLLHRDLKPDNILVTERGDPVIIDFGLAGFADGVGQESLTLDGRPFGSLPFMPPEQARGERAAITTRSDLYALGAILCHLLVGRTPHPLEGGVAEIVGLIAARPCRMRWETLTPPVPAPLRAIIEHAMAFEARHRFASADELADDLDRWLRCEPVLSQPSRWWRTLGLAVRRKPRRAVIVLLIAGTIVGLFAWGVSLRVAQAQEAARQEGLQEAITVASQSLSAHLASRDFTMLQMGIAVVESHRGAWLDDPALAEFYGRAFDPDGVIDVTVERARAELAAALVNAVLVMPDGASDRAATVAAVAEVVYELDPGKRAEFVDRLRRLIDEWVGDR
ncbi:MAG: serine/threonine protein kinase [Phycisphaerales bacterium]|nr:serine/threonine protein kinase [Phycisphaerales bacterium]